MADTDLPPKKQSRTQLNESEFYDQIESPIIKDGWRGIIAEAKGMGLELLFAGKSVTLSARHPFNDAALTRLLSLKNADLVVGGRAKKGPEAQVNLLEQILSRENMLLAWKRVKTNKGRAGMDGMSIDAFPEFSRQHWERIRSALERGTYCPAAVLRVMIPKATGGKRPLGIPTVLDRVIQQAIAQVIGPLFDPDFSTHNSVFPK